MEIQNYRHPKWIMNEMKCTGASGSHGTTETVGQCFWDSIRSWPQSEDCPAIQDNRRSAPSNGDFVKVALHPQLQILADAPTVMPTPSSSTDACSFGGVGFAHLT